MPASPLTDVAAPAPHELPTADPLPLAVCLPASVNLPGVNVPERPLRLLLEGRPAIGKTTVARRLAALLREASIPVSGIVTEELREGDRRVGFALETFAGGRGVLAHVDLPGPPRVGRYGVDLPAFERLALAALAASSAGGVVLIDELGKMELASEAFRAAVSELVELPAVWVPNTRFQRCRVGGLRIVG
jgi:nucleoside-triphosphatase